MFYKKIISAVLMLVITFFISSLAFAIEDEEEQYPILDAGKEEGARMPKAAPPARETILGIIPKEIGKFKIDMLTSTSIAYDSNYNLNRYDEEGSLYTQQTLGIYGWYPLSKKTALRCGYDLAWIKYLVSSDPDLVDNMLSVGLDAKIDKDFIWSVDCIADFVKLPHSKNSAYTMNKVGTSIKQNITDWLYHKIGYQYLIKDYDRWKTRNHRLNVRLGDRVDRRNVILHQVGVFLSDFTFAKILNKAYINDSNENYMEYYDFRAWKSKLSLAQFITDKLYETVDFTYQYKAYEKRGIPGSDEDQRDHLFIYGASLFYDLTPHTSLGLTFDLKKNYSNDNAEQYEDMIISTGLYCAF